MNNTSCNTERLRVALLLLRLGVFVVFFMWALSKLLTPDRTVAVFNKFYFYDGLSIDIAYLLGIVQLLIVCCFVLGIKKRFSYAAVFLMHLVSTLSSYKMYFDPWTSPNLLFFAAWPMLAAIAALYLLRDEDRLFTLGSI